MEWKMTVSNMTALLLILMKIAHQVMCGDCPSDAEKRMSQCTSPIVHVLNVTRDPNSLRTVGEKCRILKQIPICLDRILYECQGHTDIAPSMDILKQKTYRWKQKFDKLCESLCGSLATESAASGSQLVQGGVVIAIVTCFISSWLLTLHM